MSKNLAESLIVPQPEDTRVSAQWSHCLEILTKDISPQGFQTWITPIIPINYIDEKLFLRIPSHFFYEWLEAHFHEFLYNAVKKVFGLRARIEYVIASIPDNKPEELNFSDEKSGNNKNESTAEANLIIETEANETADYFDERYTFENFYTNQDNELALKASETVAKRPGKTDYNPLFIYGDDGCGKTHLIHAIGNHLSEKKKKKRILYLTSENFTNEYIYALQNKKIEEFNKKLCGYDVFLIDDIQFLSAKKKSQEGLYFILSELERKRKQIVITAYQPPAQILGFEKRLISFFQRGLIVDLITPSYETRLRFIDNYCANNNIEIIAEVREFLAGIMDASLQQLRAILVRISAHSSLLGRPVSLKKAEQLLCQIDAKWATGGKRITNLQGIRIEKIIRVVSEYLNTPEDILIGYNRQREVAFSRQIAIYLARKYSGESLKVIGYHFGDRHYTGVNHSVNKIEKEIKTNPMLNNLLSEIKRKLSE